jgi:hypothetical protein
MQHSSMHPEAAVVTRSESVIPSGLKTEQGIFIKAEPVMLIWLTS